MRYTWKVRYVSLSDFLIRIHKEKWEQGVSCEAPLWDCELKLDNEGEIELLYTSPSKNAPSYWMDTYSFPKKSIVFLLRPQSHKDLWVEQIKTRIGYAKGALLAHACLLGNTSEVQRLVSPETVNCLSQGLPSQTISVSPLAVLPDSNVTSAGSPGMSAELGPSGLSPVQGSDVSSSVGYLASTDSNFFSTQAALRNMKLPQLSGKYKHLEEVKLPSCVSVSDLEKFLQQFRTPLQSAILSGDHSIVQTLLAASADPSFCSEDRCTPLHLAVSMNAFEIVNTLLTSGKCEINARDNQQRTPLHYAGSDNVVKVLLSCGAHLDPLDCEMRTPLHRAAQSEKDGGLGAAQYLISKGCSVNSVTKFGETSLILAAYSSSCKLVQLLLQSKADLNTTERKYGNGVLHYAAHNGLANAVMALLRAKAYVHAQNHLHDTPLHMAAMQNQFETVQVLMEHDANVNVRNKKGQTSLHIAAMRGAFAVLEVLLGQESAYVNARDCSDFFPLNYAWALTHRGCPIVERASCECYVRCCKLLAAAGGKRRVLAADLSHYFHNTESIIFAPSYVSGEHIKLESPPIVAATIRELINRITHHDYRDQESLSTFLATYDRYINSSDLFKLLKERMQNPAVSDKDQETSSGNIAILRQRVQLRVINALKFWISTRPDDFILHNRRPLTKTPSRHACISSRSSRSGSTQRQAPKIEEPVVGNERLVNVSPKTLLTSKSGSGSPTPRRMFPRLWRKLNRRRRKGSRKLRVMSHQHPTVDEPPNDTSKTEGNSSVPCKSRRSLSSESAASDLQSLSIDSDGSNRRGSFESDDQAEEDAADGQKSDLMACVLDLARSHPHARILESQICKLVDKQKRKTSCTKTNAITPSEPLATPDDYKDKSFLDFAPDLLAEQLALLGQSILLKVDIKELLYKNFQSADRRAAAPNACKMIDRLNTTHRMLCAAVLRSRDEDQLHAMIRHLISLGQSCLHRVHDFDMLVCVTSVFNAQSVYRLVNRNWDKIGLKWEQALSELITATSMTSDMQNMRTIQATACPPFIPYFGIFTKDMYRLEESFPDYIDPPDSSLLKNHDLSRAPDEQIPVSSAKPLDTAAPRDPSSSPAQSVLDALALLQSPQLSCLPAPAIFNPSDSAAPGVDNLPSLASFVSPTNTAACITTSTATKNGLTAVPATAISTYVPKAERSTSFQRRRLSISRGRSNFSPTLSRASDDGDDNVKDSESDGFDKLISFTKCRMLQKIIGDLKRAQSSSYQIQPDPIVQGFLSLHSSDFELPSEDDLMQLSYKLKPKPTKKANGLNHTEGTDIALPVSAEEDKLQVTVKTPLTAKELSTKPPLVTERQQSSPRMVKTVSIQEPRQSHQARVSRKYSSSWDAKQTESSGRGRSRSSSEQQSLVNSKRGSTSSHSRKSSKHRSPFKLGPGASSVLQNSHGSSDSQGRHVRANSLFNPYSLSGRKSRVRKVSHDPGDHAISFGFWS